jgi:hypothetical protein
MNVPLIWRSAQVIKNERPRFGGSITTTSDSLAKMFTCACGYNFDPQTFDGFLEMYNP